MMVCVGVNVVATTHGSFVNHHGASPRSRQHSIFGPGNWVVHTLISLQFSDEVIKSVPIVMQKQGYEPVRNTGGISLDSPAAKAKGKRSATSLSRDDKDDGDPRPSKVFRMHLRGKQRMQLVPSSLPITTQHKVCSRKVTMWQLVSRRAGEQPGGGLKDSFQEVQQPSKGTCRVAQEAEQYVKGTICALQGRLSREGFETDLNESSTDAIAASAMMCLRTSVKMKMRHTTMARVTQ